MFKDTPHGPRCIPAFAIWQNGKLRRIDDACFSGHNALTQMFETIFCDGSELPVLIACEFAKHIPVGQLFLRVGTDDIASAYRILPSLWPQYTIAAVAKPGRVLCAARFQFWA